MSSMQFFTFAIFVQAVQYNTIEVCPEKTDLKVFVIVIPQEGSLSGGTALSTRKVVTIISETVCPNDTKICGEIHYYLL